MQLFYYVSRYHVMIVLENIVKPLLKHFEGKKTFFLHDIASKSGLGFNKFTVSLLALSDNAGAFKFPRQWWKPFGTTDILWNTLRVAIATRLFWTTLTWFS